jgi:glycosyltransferase involved in cell wall biosynthesis
MLSRLARKLKPTKSDAIKEKPRKIGVMSLPVFEARAGVVPLENLIRILCSLSNESYLITGGSAYDFFTQQGAIRTREVKPRTAKSLLTRPPNYIRTQLDFARELVRLRRNVDLWFLFIGGEGLALPAMTARLLGKKVIIVAPGSGLEVARARRDPLSTAAGLLRRITYGLSNRIILYSPNLIMDWNLDKYRHKVSIAHKHFLDFGKFKVQKPLRERNNRVGYIGRLSHEKGIPNFLDAIHKIAEINDEAEFVIAGDGQLRSAVEELADRLPSKVKYIGWIPHDELPEHLNELRLLVLPSYTEGLPNIILEAMACGTPVLATSVGAIPDIIKDGETGFIMENNAAKCIAGNIVRALHHPELEIIARNARALVEMEFTFEKAVATYREILDGILS